MFKNLNSTNSSPECVIEYAEHLEGLKKDFERRYEELINTTYPLWFQDLANFEPEDTMEPEVVQELLDLKENSKLSRRVQDEGVFGYIEIKSTNPQIYDLVEPSILSFPTTWLVEAGFSAVADIFTKKRNKLDVNERGTLRLKLNKTFVIDYQELTKKHQEQGSH